MWQIPRADVSIGGEEDEKVEVVGVGLDFTGLKNEVDELKSKIQILESHINEKSEELKKKDDVIALKEKIIQDSSASIAFLQTEIGSLQKKGTLHTEEQVGKANARASVLEKQVDKLKRELDIQNREKLTLETRENEAEKKINDLNSKLEDLEKINVEQKTKIRKIERALKVAEAEVVKAKEEVASRSKDLIEVHGAWLPPWLAAHLIRCQSFVGTHWNQHGKPAFDLVVEKALEKKEKAKKWAEPHLETVKIKWIPAVKEQWIVVKTKVEPHVQLLTTKTIEVYEASKSSISPHFIRVQESVDPYFQEAKRFSKPYIDQVAVATKPHVNKARVALEPYTNKVVHAYGEFLKSATTYHNQVQATVQETLKKHELTRPLATKEFEWFAASALLALPIIILARFFSAIFCKKANKPVRPSNTNHSRRKAKRVHPDK
ncbi:Myosin heavy chain-like protein [Quillaja saponaria]|uniref:Myosin heavy chain-like protein n=1 Tax=Quillaja saponaria TaxID=32244 RepID=A0AAD7LKC3_QUISA|nr:Myosin heavy chain-like protein [Quillaja saponaria]